MSCVDLTNGLIQADTFSVRRTGQSKVIETQCNGQSAADAFSVFCLVNAPESGSLCDPTSYSGPDFLFTQLQIGDIETIPQLPLLWQSSKILTNNVSGAYVSTGLSAIPLLQAYPLRYFVISQASPNIVVGLPVTAITSPNQISLVGSQVVVSYGDGLLRSSNIPNSQVWYSRPPYVSMSPSGNIMIVDTWTSTSFAPTWVNYGFNFTEIFGARVVAGPGTQRFVVWYGAISATQGRLVIYQTPDASTTPLTPYFDNIYSISASGISFKQFLTVTTDQTTLLFSTQDTTNGYAVNLLQIFPLSANGIIPINNSNWTTFFSGMVPGSVRSLTISCLGNPGQQRTISIANSYTHYLATFQLSSTDVFSFVSLLADVDFIDNDGTGQFASYATSGTFFVQSPGSAGFTGLSLPFTTSGRSQRGGFILTTTTTGTLFVTNTTTLYRNQNGNSPTWFSDFQLYSSLVPVQDIGSGSLNPIDWNQSVNWFLGTINVEVPRLAPLPYSVYSIHNRYQITITTLSSIDPQFGTMTIKHITGATLNRSNDFYILTELATTAQLYSDGNIKALDNKGNLIWQNNMHDGVNNNDQFVEMSLTRPSVSPNGLYLTEFNSGIFYVFYYPYNNLLFRTFGDQDATVFNNSIISQSNFCFANLQTDPSNPNNVLFQDLNCSCIGGSELFNRLFINVQLMPPSQQALLLDALPCIMLDCSKARIGSPPTNVVKVVGSRCTVPITICSTTIRIEDQAVLGSAAIIQDCGMEQPTACIDDVACPIGQICNNGICSTACADNNDCAVFGLPGFECRNGACFNPNAASGSSTLSAGAIAGIVVGVVVVVVLVSVLLWYFLVKKKQMAKAGKTTPPANKANTTASTTTNPPIKTNPSATTNVSKTNVSKTNVAPTQTTTVPTKPAITTATGTKSGPPPRQLARPAPLAPPGPP